MQKLTRWLSDAVAATTQARHTSRNRSPWPVRRGTTLIDHTPPDYCRPYHPEEVWHVYRCAVVYDEVMRPTGQRQGPLGSIGLDLLKLLFNAANDLTGWLEPSIGWMAAQLRRSVSAVCDAMHRLREHGFLDWLTRRVDFREEGEPGWNSVQTTSLYRLDLPAAAEKVWNEIEAKKRDQQKARAADLPPDMVVVVEERIDGQLEREAEWRAELKQRTIQRAREARQRMAKARLSGQPEQPPAPRPEPPEPAPSEVVEPPAPPSPSTFADILNALQSGTLRRGCKPFDA